MKRTLVIFIALVMGISFFGCEDDSSTNSYDNVVPQIVYMFADYSNSYLDQQNFEMVHISNTDAWGTINADPVPSFEYYMIGDSTFSGDDHCEYHPGCINYGEIWSKEDARITSNLDPLSVEVQTSYGKLNGTIELPDTITVLTLSEYDTLQLNQAFEVTWAGSNADFFFVNFQYLWQDENGFRYNTYFQHYTTGRSITYPDTLFAHDGEITFVSVDPMNGPIPEAGAQGNMTGTGSGFLFYGTMGMSYTGIIVGSGLESDLMKRSSATRDREQIKSLMRNDIVKRISGNH